MRNLKKVLSLSLALVMLLGMMVVGAGASTYADDASITNREAVEVMSGISIFTGVDGNFAPNGNLNREQAAKIIATMKLGTSVANALGSVDTVFSDVPSTSWASGVVAYCSNTGIISGRDDGLFHPWDQVTGTEFAKMLLTALGKDPARYVGANWATNTQLDAVSIGLNAGTSFTWNAPLTREQAAQMAFNGLNYAPDGTTTTYVVKNSAGTTTLYTGSDGVTASLIASLNSTTNITTQTRNAGSLGETVFGLASQAGTDAFGRATKEWTSTKDTNLKVVLTTGAARTYTSAVSYSQVYNDLGLTDASKSASYAVDGGAAATIALTRADTTNKVGAAGATTQVYVASNGDVSIVTVTNYLAKVTAVTAAKAATATTAAVPASVTVDVYGAGASGATVNGATYQTASFVSGQYVVVTVDKGDSNKIISMEAAIPVEGVITAYNGTSSATINGVAYPIAGVNTLASTGMKVNPASIGFKSTWTYYTKDGVILGGEVKTASVPTDYVYVTKLEATAGTSIMGGTNRAAVEAIFTDGTHAVIDLALTSDGAGGYTYAKPAANGTVAASTSLVAVNPADTIDNWFAYVKGDDGKYTLSAINADYAAVESGATLTEGVPTNLATTKYTTTGTAVFVVDTEYRLSSATGLVGATLTGKVLVTYDKGSSLVSAVYAVGQAATLSNQNYAYALKKGLTVANGTQWTFAINGAQQTKVVETVSAAGVTAGSIYTLTEKSDGSVTATAVVSNVAAAAKVDTASTGFFITTTELYLSNNALIFDVSEFAGTAGQPGAVDKDKWVVVIHDGSAGTKSAKVVYIVDQPPATVSSVTVTPATPSVEKGSTEQFTATVTGTYGPAQTVTWTVEGAAKEGTSINASGLLTIAADETAASLTVKATSTVDPSKSGTATVTVVTPHEHNLTWSETAKVDATCTTNGTQAYWTATCSGTGACSIAGKKYDATGTTTAASGNVVTDESLVIPATGHTWEQGQDNSGSGGENLSGKHVCSVCGDKHDSSDATTDKGCTLDSCTNAG